MADFTHHYPEAGPPEVYASTSKYMRFAIHVMDIAYSKLDHASIAHWYNNLLPLELKDMQYLPAEAIVRGWAKLFFSNRGRGWLIPTHAMFTGRRKFDGTSWTHDPGDSRPICVLDGTHTSHVDMIARLHYFLAWLSPLLNLTDDVPGNGESEDTWSLLYHCRQWADAFMQPNADTNWYGHRVTANSWTLYNFVHVGPPPDAPVHTSDPELQFRFAFEGFPDSPYVVVSGYSRVAQAFVHLAQVAGDDKYSKFASDINDGLWRARLNQSTYLMPDTVTSAGPLPGDQDSNPPYKYKHDTDCLYWARGMYDTYRLGGSVQPSLAPSAALEAECVQIGNQLGPRAALYCRIRQRRKKLESLLNEFPNKYLGMALGLTLDWIRFGWRVDWKQFIRKIHHDGTPAEATLYGDGKWNTLFVLIEAYRFTHDDFYLGIFDDAWSKLTSLADQLDGGLFPERLEQGQLPNPPVAIERYQEAFLDVIVTAYEVSVDAGAPRPGYLTAARQLADKIMEQDSAGAQYYELHNGILCRALLRLAQATGTLRRVVIVVSENDVTALAFQNNVIGAIELSLSGQQGEMLQRAVVYMDDGEYSVVKHFVNGTAAAPLELVVTADAQVTL